MIRLSAILPLCTQFGSVLSSVKTAEQWLRHLSINNLLCLGNGQIKETLF